MSSINNGLGVHELHETALSSHVASAISVVNDDAVRPNTVVSKLVAVR